MFVRDKRSERTGYQEAHAWDPRIDFQTDFVMVYGLDATTPERIAAFRAEGYQVHLMTGCAWGEYQDYLFGRWDGEAHWDEAQMDREGNHVLHGPDVPYMVPVPSFMRYLEEKLRAAVDAGIEAIHVEEPEFWSYSGYSKAFKAAYEAHYHEPWSDPLASPTAAWRQAELKALMYRDLIAYLSKHLKAYARSTGQEDLRFYVPTHSLINYSQWGIMSPEGLLASIEDVDGIIAQVWTGTSREAQVYKGLYKERTFENAYLEYSVMGSLRFREDQRIWFLQDPIEDNPTYSWDDYQPDYKRTLIAALLHPEVAHYEVCPWPWRVFTGVYPREHAFLALESAEPPRGIPEAYASLLAGCFNLLGTMDQAHVKWVRGNGATGTDDVGVFIADTSLYQRTALDDQTAEYQKSLHTFRRIGTSVVDLLPEVLEDRDAFDALRQTTALTDFAGLTMPLMKDGCLMTVVQLEQLLTSPEKLRRFKVLVLSYDFMKPRSAQIHHALRDWIEAGGTLLYIGDGEDPWHAVPGWWTETGIDRADTALFDTLGVAAQGDLDVTLGQGRFIRWTVSPTTIALVPEWTEAYVQKVRGLAHWTSGSVLHLERGPYDIMAYMDEGEEEPYCIMGRFIDLWDPSWPRIEKMKLMPGEQALVLNLDRVDPRVPQVLATSARILSFEPGEATHLSLRTPTQITSTTRLVLPSLWERTATREVLCSSDHVEVTREEEPGHFSLRYRSKGRTMEITLA